MADTGTSRTSPLPIPRSIELEASTVVLLAEAEAALGRLAGVSELVPNPRVLVRPYVLREAVSSARIEGIRASLTDVFAREIFDVFVADSDVLR